MSEFLAEIDEALGEQGEVKQITGNPADIILLRALSN